MRGIAILFAGYLMNLWWLCGVGALYLIYLAAKHFLVRGDTNTPQNVCAESRGNILGNRGTG